MVNFHPVKVIGQTFFFLKFYLFVCVSYFFNFSKQKIEKIIYGNSKTVVCPFEKTHPDVFLTICTFSIIKNNSLLIKDTL